MTGHELLAQGARPAAGDTEPETGPDAPLLFGGKLTTRSKIEPTLSVPVREALDRWTEPAARLDLRVALGQRPEHIVLGHCPDETLTQVAAWLDDAFEILDPLVPRVGDRSEKATVAILVDEDYVQSPAWTALLDELQQQRLLIADAVNHLSSSPEGVTLRQAPLFLQPTWDIAGNAAEGDDEFRLGNEVVHKFAHCLVTSRAGQQPGSLLWGLGYVVEQKLFQSAYHFNVAGFVASDTHSDWKAEAQLLVQARLKEKDFSLGAMAAKHEAAGQAKPPQILTWAGLAYLSQKNPEAVRDMLLALHTIQFDADPAGTAPSYTGDQAKTREALSGSLDAIPLKDLNGWLKSKSKPKPKAKK